MGHRLRSYCKCKRKLYTFCVHLSALLSLLLFASSVLADEERGIVFERETFEFRASTTASVEEFDLPFANRSQLPVKILDAETSCSCMGVTVAQTTLQPGEKGRVHCLFHIPNALGPIQKPVILKTDAPDQPQRLVQVRVEVPSILQFTPERLTWAVGEAPTEKVFRIRNTEQSPVRVTDVECSRDAFEWSLQTIRDGQEYELHIKPKATGQRALGMFLLHTDSTVPRQKLQSVYAVVESPQPVATP